MRHGSNWMIRAANQRYQRLRGSLITDPRLSRAASFVTPCVRPSSRHAEKYPPYLHPPVTRKRPFEV
jgi:hypothetical protein